MKYVAALSLIVGAALGAGAVEGLHAQGTPPVYQVTLQQVSDAESFTKEFVPAARAAVEKFGGQPLAASAPLTVEGTTSFSRAAINIWPGLEQVHAWYLSPEYKSAREIGDKYAKFEIFLIQGIAQ